MNAVTAMRAHSLPTLPRRAVLSPTLPHTGEGANVKVACFDLRDKVSLRDVHVNE